MVNISNTQWKTIWITKTFLSKTITIKILYFKVLTKWYMIPPTLKDINPNNNPLYWKQCKWAHVHCWWNCSFWGTFFCIRLKAL